MQADFSLAGDLVIEVATDRIDRTVKVRTRTGIGISADGKAIERSVERELSLPKGEARAIASAIMGAAAEL